MESYPLESVPTLFGVDEKLTVKINPSLEGLDVTEKMLRETTTYELRKLLSLEFCWLPAEVVEAYNGAKTEEAHKQVLIEKVYGNCKLNCKGCFAKQDDLFKGHDLVHPDKIMDLIEESVRELGTKTVKYLGPTEFFRDKDVFKYLDRFEKMGIILGVFAKDPMFGNDAEVEALFSDQGIHTAEELIVKLASYQCLRIIFNFRSFDDQITNDLVRGGYVGKEDYAGDYKKVQNRALQLLYKYFAQAEFAKGKEARLVILNAPITPETISEAKEIFQYFTDRGLLVVSTTSMQSGCGGKIYQELNSGFMEKFAQYYATAIKYSVKRGLITHEYVEQYGPSPYAGTRHCIQMCSGLIVRETGQLMRCPGADHKEWQDGVTPEELMEHGIVWAWPKTKNYAQELCANPGCLAKPAIFTSAFNDRVMDLYKEMV
ncbi:MAG: hypothetical protein WCJ51_01570 [Candidatus Moraniibacteriota bacterium]